MLTSKMCRGILFATLIVCLAWVAVTSELAPRRHGTGASSYQGRDHGAGDDMYQRRMSSSYPGDVDNSDRRSYQDLEDANQDSVITATSAPGKDGCRTYKNDVGMSCRECVKTGKGKNGEVERQSECVGERKIA